MTRKTTFSEGWSWLKFCTTHGHEILRPYNKRVKTKSHKALGG